MPKEQGFRVFGDVIDREESYLDLEVDGVDENGRIYLTHTASGESWSFTPGELADLHDDRLLVGTSNIPVENHQIWKDLDNIGSTRANVNINDRVDENLGRSQEHLFKAILEAGR